MTDAMICPCSGTEGCGCDEFLRCRCTPENPCTSFCAQHPNNRQVPVQPPSILDEAASLVNDAGDRNDAYGHPAENFAKIAAVWSLILGTEVTPRQVALMMIGMKIVRDSHKARRDNLVDIAGYARAAERLTERPSLTYYTRKEG